MLIIPPANTNNYSTPQNERPFLFPSLIWPGLYIFFWVTKIASRPSSWLISCVWGRIPSSMTKGYDLPKTRKKDGYFCTYEYTAYYKIHIYIYIYQYWQCTFAYFCSILFCIYYPIVQHILYYNHVRACPFCIYAHDVNSSHQRYIHVLYLASKNYLIVYVQLYSHELVWTTMSANRCRNGTMNDWNHWETFDIPITCCTLCNLHDFTTVSFHDTSLTMSGVSKCQFLNLGGILCVYHELIDRSDWYPKIQGTTDASTNVRSISSHVWA